MVKIAKTIGEIYQEIGDFFFLLPFLRRTNNDPNTVFCDRRFQASRIPPTSVQTGFALLG